ncbi:MAG: hypothetical protein JO072_11800 [Parafilimonas sp.]|nr:hypothetical protein [Parafilimonas sp.]
MTTSITAQGKIVVVEFKLHAIRIFSSDVLQQLLKDDPQAGTQELIGNIKKEYQRLFNKDFNVSDSSMSVEIWAHVYADRFAEGVKEYSSINIIDKIAEKIIQHADVIDIGEKGHDENRFFWNGLAPFKEAIANILFGSQKK